MPLRAWLVEIFAVGNLAFLAVDIYLAHLANAFARPAEWIPIVFSVLTPVLLIPTLVTRRLRTGWGRSAGLVAGAASILVALAGFVLHLESTFFREQSLQNLVYTAPFAAPLAYGGIGLLLVLNRLERVESRDWGRWVVVLALGGFIGNFALSLADHAQNGFFEPIEWIPVVAAAVAVGFLLPVSAGVTDRVFLQLCVALMAIEAVVGVAGFGLHLSADLTSAATTVREKFVHGAPIFAPLLFPNLALLATLGLWHLSAVCVRD